MRIIYSILVNLLLILLPIKLLLRSIKETGYRKNIKERFGFVKNNNESRVWIHCISVGESIAAKPLITELLKNKKLIVTCTTASGREQLTRMFAPQIKSNAILLSYIPIDHPLVLRLAIKNWMPSEVIFVETDIWPNICRICKSLNIKLSIINARMSEKSFKGYLKLGSFFTDTLKCFNIIAVQYQKDADHFIALGANPDILTITGSIKADITFDAEIRREYEIQKDALNRPVWIAASTHAPEEEKILECHKDIVRLVPEALLILVPRHPNRFNEVATLIDHNELNYNRRSIEGSFIPQNNVFLADSVGELLQWILLSDVVFMGKSIECRGGHNPLEAAYLSKAIISGPGIENFNDIYQELFNQKGAYKIHAADELVEHVTKLFRNKSIANEMGMNALKTYNQFSGALDKTLQLIN